MENKKRIEELTENIQPLMSKRLRLNTSLFFKKENYSNTLNNDLLSEINNLKKEISELDSSLEPLYNELRSLQSKYLIEYRIELNDIRTESKYYQTFRDSVFMTKNTQVDTFLNGWGTIDTELNQLIQEVGRFLLNRSSSFELLNIKTL